MSFKDEDIRANRDFFAAKLRAEKQRHDVVTAIDKGTVDFVLLDTRQREAFGKGHIPTAWCVPWEELEQAIPHLPRDRELVTYCWSHD